MEIMNKEEIRSIIFNAEVMMYGTVEFRIDRNDEETIIAWTAIADGGSVISHGEKQIQEKYFSDTVNILGEIMSVTEDDETGDVCWALQVLTNSNEELFFRKQVIGRINQLID